MIKASVLCLTAILLLVGCEKKSSIEGLWVVKSVVIGEQKNTPNARWVRFNSDLTQESGNGRFQHSYGTWNFTTKSNELTIQNTNGLDDLNDPFKVTIEDDQMFWERNEEGQNMKVTLVRLSKLPETHGDKVLGLWSLKSVTGNGSYFEEDRDTKETGAYLFFRWDKRFVINSGEGRINGVYNVHGHRPEVELIPYGDDCKREFWEVQYEENRLTLTLLNTEKTVKRIFKRIRRFPE